MSITESYLERMLLDEDTEPKALPFSLLAEITNDFSHELEIGRGGFAIVYKAMLEHGDVAVKRLSSNAYMYETEFHREIECLMKVKHKNIVRFLGYCADTQGNVGTYNGKFVMADLQHRLLCFEYLQKGSLHDYIEDASGGLEWRERYKIIKGICEGLSYLHQKNILHLDLKPANILLDGNMVPKISDFGLSRCFEEDQTQAITAKVIGTMGYLAPEHTSHVITHKFDLYSLGVIITEILTGKRGYQAIEDVLRSWRNRLPISHDNAELEQIKVCAEIGLECTEFNPGKRPHSVKHIMDRLVETEGGEVIPGCEPEAGPMELLSVHPLQLCYPFESMKLTLCSLHLTSNISEHVAFRLIMDDTKQDPAECFIWLPAYGIVPPRSTYTLVVPTLARTTQVTERNHLILESTTLASGDEYMINKFQKQGNNFFEEVKDRGTNVVQQVRLEAVYTPPSTKIITSSSSSKPISPEIEMINMNLAQHECPFDIIYGRQWIITGQDNGRVSIWDNQTKKIVNFLKVSDRTVTCVKFISRKQWFVAGTTNGVIHVYNCKMRKITSFSKYTKAVGTVAVHPTKPYLLSSYCHKMLLWDWDKGWKCAQSFENEHSSDILHLVFNPKESIAASNHNIVKVWSINSFRSRFTLSGHLAEVNCLDFFTCYDQEYLITGSDDRTAKIWDLQKKICVRTLEVSISPVTAVLYEPKLQILITGLRAGCIYLWCAASRINSRSPRFQRIVNIGPVGPVNRLTYLMGRVFITKEKATAILNIDNNGNDLEDSTDECSEPLLSLCNDDTKRPARDTSCKVTSSRSQILDVTPELINLTCEPSEVVSWSVHLRNNRDEHVAFILKENIPKALAKLPLCGIVPSRSSYNLIVSATKEELATTTETCFDLILQSSTSAYAVLFSGPNECDLFFVDTRNVGNYVHEATVLLNADYHVPQPEETQAKIRSMKDTDDEIYCLDVHPTEQWIITGHANGDVRTWNHETQGPLTSFKVSGGSVASVKVIARKQWILAMSDHAIYVYNCTCVTKMQEITSFRCERSYTYTSLASLAVHPVLPYVQSTSRVIWDWDKGWERIRGYSRYDTVTQIAYHPKDANSYACVSKKVVQVWNTFRSHKLDYTLSGHSSDVNCLHFFARVDGQYLITGSDDCTAKIWDWQKMECIHTMEVMSPVTCVISLPDILGLVTGSKHGTVQLWSSTDFRLKTTVDLGGTGCILGLACFMGSRRVVVGQERTISVIEVSDDEEEVPIEGSKEATSVLEIDGQEEVVAS